MGLNVSGIYIDANKKNITPQKVTDFVRSYWLELGAKESKKNPLSFQPLKLEKTGFLGFAIGPKSKDRDGNLWIGIYDSEHYRADHELAESMASHFKTDVWIYGVTDSVNQAYAKKYGQQREVIRNYNEAYNKAEFFPYSFLYFHQLSQFSKKQLKDFTFLAFGEVPCRPGKGYSGPSGDRLHTNELVIQANEYIASRNAQKLVPLAKNDDVYREVIASAIQNINPSNPENLAFIWALADMTLQKKESFCSVAEAALRMKNEKKFKQIMDFIPDYSLYMLEQRAWEVAKNGEYYLAFRLYEAQLVRTDYQAPKLLNNAVYFLLYVIDHPGISSKRLRKLMKKAYEAGPFDPAIFHGLACIYVVRRDYNMAIDCVENALRYKYEAVDSLRDDPDLDPIKSDPRFQAAFQKGQNL